MIDTVLLQGLELTRHQPNIYQQLTAVFVVLIAFAFLFFVRTRAPFVGLDFDEVKTKKLLKGGMKNSNWKSTYINKSDTKEERRMYLNKLITGEVNEIDTLKGTLIETRKALAENSNNIPSEIIRYSGIGVIYLIVGLIALGGVSIIPSLPDTDIQSIEFVSEIASILSIVANQFPMIELFGAMLLYVSYGLSVLIFNQFMVIALILILLGLSLAIIRDKYGENRVPKKARPDIKSKLLMILGGSVIVFLTGILLNTFIGLVFRGVNFIASTDISTQYAEYISGLFIGLLVLLLLLYSVKQAYNLLKLAYIELLVENDEGEIINEKEARINLTYYVLSVSSKILTLIAMIMIPVYVIYSIYTGRITDIVSMVFSASLLQYILVFSFIGIVSLIIGLYFNQSVKVLSEGLNRVITLKSVRTKFYLSVTPFLIWFATIVFVWAIPEISVVYGIIAGFIFALVARLVVSTTQKLRYKMTSLTQSDFVPPARALVEITSFSVKSEHDPIYIARVDGDYTVLSLTEDDLYDTIQRILDYKFNDGYIPLTVESVVYNDAEQLGQIDYDKSKKRIRNKVNHVIIGTLKNNNGFASESKLIKRASEYAPEEYIRDELKYLRRSGRIDRTGKSYQLLRDS